MRKGSHEVPLLAQDTVFSLDWGLSCVTAVYDHLLFGRETMLTRTLSLNVVMMARFRVLAELPKWVRDREKERCQ